MNYITVVRRVCISLFMFTFCSNCHAFFKDLDVWEEGNQYVKLVALDVVRSARNDHPTEIDSKALAIAFQHLKAKGDNNNYRIIFSKGQSEQLAVHIQEGLNTANSKLDLVFVLDDKINKGKFITGRVFYIGGRLNLILGERAGEPGLRARTASNFFNIVDASGIKYNADRNDWLQLHYEQIANNIEIEALKAVTQNTPTKAKLSKEKSSQKESNPIDKNNSEEARQARELRLENARLKKKLREQKNNGASELTMEERLVRLKNLYDKKLISLEKYDAKRTSILEGL